MSSATIDVSDAVLRTDDGVTIAARWFVPVSLSPSGVAVVIVHGFAAYKEHPAVVATAGRLVERGHPVLVYDARGHGASSGACTLGIQERFDVAVAVRAAAEQSARVVVVGASMGGIAVLNHLALLDDVARFDDRASAMRPAGIHGASGAVVVSTPAVWRMPRNPRGVLSVMLTQTRMGRTVAARRMGVTIAPGVRRAAPPSQQIGRAGCPIAVVHGVNDRFIPVSAARQLHDAARPPRAIDVVAGMTHGYCTAAVDAIDTRVGWVVDQLDDAGADRPETSGADTGGSGTYRSDGDGAER